MIKYNLKCISNSCKNSASFDGWFQSISAFEDQKISGLLTCPYCGGNDIVKNLMSPSIKSTAQNKKSLPLENPSEKDVSVKNLLDNKGKNNKIASNELHTILRSIKKEIEKNAEYVGNKFVKEARAIKSGEAKDRPIYGHAEPKKIEELKNEGIEVSAIPWIQDDH